MKGLNDMPYYAENKEQAYNGLSFWKDIEFNPETHETIRVLGFPVHVPKA